jgi:hypothetical protein
LESATEKGKKGGGDEDCSAEAGLMLQTFFKKFQIVYKRTLFRLIDHVLQFEIEVGIHT